MGLTRGGRRQWPARDDLALLVDLIASGWKGVDNRLAKLEERLQGSSGAIVYRIEERRGGNAELG